MNNKTLSDKSLAALRLVLAVNFNAAMIFLFLVGTISVVGNSLIFENQSDLYGPMASNLRLLPIYLCLTELSVYSYCRFEANYQGLMVLGIFLLLLVVSIEFYGAINQVPVDENYRWFFLYLGLSHVAFASLKSTEGLTKG